MSIKKEKTLATLKVLIKTIKEVPQGVKLCLLDSCICGHPKCQETKMLLKLSEKLTTELIEGKTKRCD